MTFTTLSFALFFAIVFLCHWSTRNHKAQNVVLLIASYAFYGWWDPRFCGLMLLSTLVDFFAALRVHHSRSRALRRFWLTTSIATNLAILCAFKYFNFFQDSLAELLGSLGWPMEAARLHLVLPVGISFYTFQTMGYTIDVYRRELVPRTSLIDYGLYVSFFAQLVAGPIERGARLLPQFEKPRVFSRSQATDACRQILWGVVKKLLIADNLARLVDPVYAWPSTYSGPALALATVFFAFQIYCDFSGYSDIAIGVARLLGIDLMRNFAFPYFSQSMNEFWRRWHISLSTWFRDYVYIPLGGSRSRPFRRKLNVLTTFVLSGLWHGAAFNFVVWGLLHGVAVIPAMSRRARRVLQATDVPCGPGRLPSVPAALRIARTFVLACVGWVFFRASTAATGIDILTRIVGDVLDATAYEPLSPNQCVGLFLVGALVVVEWTSREVSHPLQKTATWDPYARFLLNSALIWLVIIYSPARSTPFIYFQF